MAQRCARPPATQLVHELVYRAGWLPELSERERAHEREGGIEREGWGEGGTGFGGERGRERERGREGARARESAQEREEGRKRKEERGGESERMCVLCLYHQQVVSSQCGRAVRKTFVTGLPDPKSSVGGRVSRM